MKRWPSNASLLSSISESKFRFASTLALIGLQGGVCLRTKFERARPSAFVRAELRRRNINPRDGPWAQYSIAGTLFQGSALKPAKGRGPFGSRLTRGSGLDDITRSPS